MSASALPAMAGTDSTPADTDIASAGELSVDGRQNWLVSLALPIEADTPAEAVRQFWQHLVALGPAELPTYVWPYGDELAMRSFVLGEEPNQDPED